MIVLDTNVLSELVRARPHPKVVAWVSHQARSQVFTTAISRGEMVFGVLVLPIGERRRRLQQEVQAIFDTDMAGRVLPYDGDAAEAHAAFAAARRGQGRPVSLPDAMIAGIASSRGATLATRNLRDFEGCGITLVDPWD
ncbi:MAG TPA: type II toxin-antitoxin system VapC family toxin [Dyella sp.]|nr:type II toxin-antitoxin system VapC family toxin [Dyella sp.]